MKNIFRIYFFVLIVFLFLFIQSVVLGETSQEQIKEKQETLHLTQSLSQNVDCSLNSFLDVSVELTYTGESPLLTLGLQEIIPEGLVYEGIVGGSPPPLQPAYGASGTLEFGWIFVPSFPVSFTFRLKFRQPISGTQSITGTGIYGSYGDTQETEPVITYFDCPIIEGQLEGEGILEGVNEGTTEGEGQIEGEGQVEGEGISEEVSFNISSKTGNIYSPEQEMEFEINISYLNPLEITALGARVFLPIQWQFIKFTGGSPPPIYNFDTETGQTEFAWIFVPSGGVTFSFSVSVSPYTEGNQEISGYGIYRTTGAQIYTRTSKIYLSPTPRADLAFVSGNVTPGNPLSNSIITISYTAENSGRVNINDQNWVDSFFLSKNEELDETDIEIHSLINNFLLNVEDNYSNSTKVKLPFYITGDYYVLVLLNKTTAVYEESRDNNVGVIGHIQIQPREYDFQLFTDFNEGNVGTPIPIRIYVFNPDNNQPAPNKQIVLQIEHRGFIIKETYTTDLNGEIHYNYNPTTQTEGGIYQISIKDPREEGFPINTEVSLRGLAITPTQYTFEVTPNKTKTIPFEIINLGDTEEQGLSFQVAGIPSDWNYDYVIPSTINGQSNATCKLIVYPKSTTQENIPVTLLLQSSSGRFASVQYDIKPKPYQTIITTIPEEISLPLLIGETILYTIEVKNEGGKDSGPAQIFINPENPNIHLVTPNIIQNIHADGRYFISLQINVPFTEIPESIETALYINFQSGIDVTVPIQIIPNPTRQLSVSVFDKYTNGPINGASISIISEAGIFTSTETNVDGIVEIDDIPESPFSVVILKEGFESQTFFISETKNNKATVKAYLEPFLSEQFWSYGISENQTPYLISISNTNSLESNSISLLTVSPSYITLNFTKPQNYSNITISNHWNNAINDIYLYPFQSEFLTAYYPIQYSGRLGSQDSIQLPLFTSSQEISELSSLCSSSAITGITFLGKTEYSNISQFISIPLWNTESLCPNYTPVYGDLFKVIETKPDTIITPIHIEVQIPDTQTKQNIPILSYATSQMTLSTGEILPITAVIANNTSLFEQLDIQWEIQEKDSEEDISYLFQIFKKTDSGAENINSNSINKEQWFIYPLHEFWEYTTISEIKLIAQIHISSLQQTWNLTAPPLPIKILPQPILTEHKFYPQTHELQISSSAENPEEIILPLAVLVSTSENTNNPIKFDWENIQYLHETGIISPLSLIQMEINGLEITQPRLSCGNLSFEKGKVYSYLWYLLSPPISSKWEIESQWTYINRKKATLPLTVKEQHYDLIHVVDIIGENASIMTGLLSNDDWDEQRIPDNIYLPNGNTLSIFVPSNPVWVPTLNSPQEYGITYTSPSQTDYIYLHSNFPNNVPEDAVILRIRRTDMTVIPTANYWVSRPVSAYPKHDSAKPSLHFVDKTGHNSYIVEFQSESLENKPPIANAGEDITNVYRPSSITLDGTGSYDPDGDRINYSWRLVSKPFDSIEYLRNTNTANPILIPDLPGTYIAQLIVSDGFAQSEPDTVTIEVINRLPEIIINGPQKARPRDVVTIDASSTIDPDGDTIDFLWKLVAKPDNSRVSLQGVLGNRITITPDLLGKYEFLIYISDGFENTFTNLQLDVYNHLPQIVINYPSTVYLDSNVSVSALNTFDVDNDPLSYQWRLLSTPSGSTAVLSSLNQSEIYFTTDKRGIYTLKLEVSDTYEKTDKTISLQCVNRKPQTVVIPSATEIPHGEAVIFDATQSLDLDKDPLFYDWQLLSRPILSSAEIYLIQNNIASLKTDAPGKYRVTLQTNDGFESGEIVTSEITAINTPPVMQCPEQIFVGSVRQPVTLLPPEANDLENDLLTYHWEIITKPTGSILDTMYSNESEFTFIPDRKGTYEIRITTSDPWGGTTSCVITVEVSNQRPVAFIQSEAQCFINTPVTLSSEGSYDPDGDTIKAYQWTLMSKPQGSFTQLLNPTASMTHFTPDRNGNYQIQLQVFDGDMWSNPAVVTITTQNRAPLITVISAEYLEVGIPMILDASLSYDPDGDPLSFSWKLLSKPQLSRIELNNTEENVCSFTPDYPGYYSIELIVSDPYSSVARKEITLRTLNVPPIAIISAPQIIKVGDTITIDGTGSYDPDGDTITYQWQLSFQPNGSTSFLSSLTRATTNLYIDKEGTYTIELQVSDGKTLSDITKVSLSTGNVAPVAVVEKDKNAVLGTKCYLDASSSYDPNNDELIYYWSFLSKPVGSQAEIFDGNSSLSYFIPDVEGNYEIQLIVSDGKLFSKPVVIRVSTTNKPPVARLKQTVFQVYTGDVVTIDASDSYDEDNTPINYEWVLLSKPVNSETTIQNAEQPIVTLNIDKKGFYQGTLVVNDGFLRSNTVHFQITCINRPPFAIIKGPSTVGLDEKIILDGSESYDLDNEKSELTYRWSVITVPTGSSVALSDITAKIIEFVADIEGIYEFELTVNDGEVDSAPAHHKVTVICNKPTPPSGISATDGIYLDRIVITWNASLGANEYRVYSNDKDDLATAVPISPWINSLYYEDIITVEPQEPNKLRCGCPKNCNEICVPQEKKITKFYWVIARINESCLSELSNSESGFIVIPSSGQKLPDFLCNILQIFK